MFSHYNDQNRSGCKGYDQTDKVQNSHFLYVSGRGSRRSKYNLRNVNTIVIVAIKSIASPEQSKATGLTD